MKLLLRFGVCSSLAVLAFTSSVQAAFLPTHASTGVYPTVGTEYPVALGVGSAQYSYYKGPEGNGTAEYWKGSATAGPGGLRAQAQGGDAENDVYVGNAIAVAAWRDIVYFDGGAPPDLLRLVFQVHATLDVRDVRGVYQSRAAVYVGASPGLPGWTNNIAYQGGSLGYNRFASVSKALNGQEEVVTTISTGGVWDSFSFVAGEVNGQFHIDVGYNPLYGGYGWGVQLGVQADARNAFVTANAGNTLRLTAVTTTDGRAAPVTFDSGMSFAPVTPAPAPPGLVLVASGAIGLLGRRRFWASGSAKPANEHRS